MGTAAQNMVAAWGAEVVRLTPVISAAIQWGARAQLVLQLTEKGKKGETKFTLYLDDVAIDKWGE